MTRNVIQSSKTVTTLPQWVTARLILSGLLVWAAQSCHEVSTEPRPPFPRRALNASASTVGMVP